MDKTTKFILGLIAVALIGINVQMWNGKTGLIKPAYARSDVVYNVCYNGPTFGSDSLYHPKQQMEDKWGSCR